jgi:putative nucleotidyltransferase with HDIG domain
MQDEVVSTRMPRGDLSALLRVSLALSGSLDLTVVMQTAIDAAVEVLGFDTGAIYRIEDGELVLGATTPELPPDFPDTLRVAPLADHPTIARALGRRAPVVLADASAAALTPAEFAVTEARALTSVMYIPLLVEGRSEGVMIVGSQWHLIEFSAHDADVCRTLSAQVALALQNAKLMKAQKAAADELADAYDATIEGWSLALEMRDQETLGHTQRAARLACELARALGISDAELPHVRMGALLHDIGKMVVPDAILHKPGPLDDAEWVVMRAHPVVAQEFLSRIEYLQPGLDIPYCHHERWDGSGYPRGLKGPDIPLAARIFAVIDVYDALTSDPPYRAAWSPHDALEHIRHRAGSDFDPAVVEVFAEGADTLAELLH